MIFSFMSDLSESRLLPSKTSIKDWKPVDLAELAYLYFIGLHILLCSESERSWAQSYCRKSGEPNDFGSWLNAKNDMYALLYSLSEDSDKDIDLGKINIAPGIVRHWLRHVTTDNRATRKEETHKLFMRLDTMFHITDSAMKKLRRTAMNWDETDDRDRKDALTKLIQLIHERAPSNSEILPRLKALEKKDEKVVEESASSGGTGSANVATSVGGLGAGFDPDGEWRSIYSKKKPVMIRRTPLKDALRTDK